MARLALTWSMLCFLLVTGCSMPSTKPTDGSPPPLPMPSEEMDDLVQRVWHEFRRSGAKQWDLPIFVGVDLQGHVVIDGTTQHKEQDITDTLRSWMTISSEAEFMQVTTESDRPTNIRRHVVAQRPRGAEMDFSKGWPGSLQVLALYAGGAPEEDAANYAKALLHQRLGSRLLSFQTRAESNYYPAVVVTLDPSNLSESDLRREGTELVVLTATLGLDVEIQYAGEAAVKRIQTDPFSLGGNLSGGISPNLADWVVVNDQKWTNKPTLREPWSTKAFIDARQQVGSTLPSGSDFVVGLKVGKFVDGVNDPSGYLQIKANGREVPEGSEWQPYIDAVDCLFQRWPGLEEISVEYRTPDRIVRLRFPRAVWFADRALEQRYGKLDLTGHLLQAGYEEYRVVAEK